MKKDMSDESRTQRTGRGILIIVAEKGKRRERSEGSERINGHISHKRKPSLLIAHRLLVEVFTHPGQFAHKVA